MMFFELFKLCSLNNERKSFKNEKIQPLIVPPAVVKFRTQYFFSILLSFSSSNKDIRTILTQIIMNIFISILGPSFSHKAKNIYERELHYLKSYFYFIFKSELYYYEKYRFYFDIYDL